MSDITDPIDGLIQYVNEIKPYHSKIIEVLTEYVYEEDINVTLSESSVLDVGIFIDRVDLDSEFSESQFGGGFGSGYYDSARYTPIIAVNTSLVGGAFDSTDINKKGYEASANRITLPGNVTATYRPSRTITVELVRHNNITGDETTATSNDFVINSSTYVTTGQTNGVTDNPRTVLILSGLIDESTLALGADESWAANVRLTPEDVNSVVLSNSADTNTSRIRYSTTPLLGPGTLASTPYTPPSPSTFGDGNIATLDNYIEIVGDVTASYPFGASLFLLLANGDQFQYTVANSYFDQTNTIINLLEDLDPLADYTGAKVVEGFFGYSEDYVIPSSALESTPEGLTQTNIDEGITFSWNDGTDEVIDFKQFLIKETIAGNIIVLALDGRTVADFLSVGDVINIVEQDAGNNGQHTITNITETGSSVEITVSNSLNISSDTGFLETT